MSNDVTLGVNARGRFFVVRKRHIGQQIYASVEGARDPLVVEQVLLAAGLRRLNPLLTRDCMSLVVETEA